MNKPSNESHGIAVQFGTQLRYVSTKRIRKLRARARRDHQPIPQHRHITGKLWSYLYHLPPIKVGPGAYEEAKRRAKRLLP